MSKSQVLENALRLFGENGHRWVNRCGSMYEGTLCALNALGAAEEGMECVCSTFQKANGLEGSDGIARWNDDHSRTWPEVKDAFNRAIALARQEESLDAPGK
jgi:hypothetical protein